MLGGKFLTFHAKTSALPSIDVKFDFKRENISEADMLARLKRTTAATNTVGGKTQWLPAKSIGRRTLHVIEVLNNRERSMRNYRWLVSERNIECTVAISGSPAEFAKSIAAFEASLEAAISGSENQKPAEPMLSPVETPPDDSSESGE